MGWHHEKRLFHLGQLITRNLHTPNRYIDIFVLLVIFLSVRKAPLALIVLSLVISMFSCMDGRVGISMDLSLCHLGLIFWERRSIQRPKDDSEGAGFLMFVSEGVGIFRDG